MNSNKRLIPSGSNVWRMKWTKPLIKSEVDSTANTVISKPRAPTVYYDDQQQFN